MPIYNAPLKKIDETQTRRYAGLAAADFSSKAIHDACTEMLYTAEPHGSWEIYDYDTLTYTILSTNPFTLNGNKIRQHLTHCNKVIVLAVTIGSNIEHIIETTFQTGKYTHALLLDAAATTAVEQTADNLEKNIDPFITSMGYKRIWRFSPGYGDWNISCQPQMLKLANAAAIDVSHTSSMMLIPRKSVTAIIGLIPQTDNFSPEKPSCNNCQQKNCLSRIKFHK